VQGALSLIGTSPRLTAPQHIVASGAERTLSEQHLRHAIMSSRPGMTAYQHERVSVTADWLARLLFSVP
jgi:hypothetical protein